MEDFPVIYSEKLVKYDEIKFGFSTRKGGVSPSPLGLNLSFNVGDDRMNVLENRERFLSKLQIDLNELAIPRQVQGGLVRRVDSQGGYDACDGLITNVRGVYLTVSTADCLSIYLFDPVQKAIGAVHAGWRGSSMNIVSRALLLMSEEFGTIATHLVVYIAPAAGVCCYEVGEEVARNFKEEFIIRPDKSKPHLNLKIYTKSELLDSGVQEANIEISNYCTICTPELFHSYRRDGNKSGRMMGVIGLRN
jgi:polyphenol oxidase